MNKVILLGRLVADPELRTTQSGLSVTSARIAVNRRFAKSTDAVNADFFDVVFWRQTAEFVSKYFSKGRQIAIVGTLQNRKWQDKDGNTRYSTEIVADEAYFADSKKDAASGSGLSYQDTSPQYRDTSGPGFNQDMGYAPAKSGDFYEADDDDSDLPF